MQLSTLRCPACGQNTLATAPITLPQREDYLQEGEGIACTNTDCWRPSAAQEILADRETEHVVSFDETGFVIRHPLRERLDDALLYCELHEECQEMGSPPEEGPGRYRAVYVGHDPDSSSLHAPMYDLIKLEDA